MFKTFGARLKELRDEAGYSQQFVADHCDLTQRQLWEYEHNIHAPDLIRFARLMEFYGIEIPILKGAQIHAHRVRRSDKAVS